MIGIRLTPMTAGPGRPRHDDVLTPAEWKVAEQVRHGLTSRRIAERMGVSIDAVKFHVGNALSKLGFSGREQLRLWDGVAKGTALHHMRRRGMGVQTATDSYMMLGQIARTTKQFEESHTRTLLVHENHAIERSGPYRIIRHPGYAGSLLCLNGIALGSCSAAVFALSAAATFSAYAYRIRIEGRMLVDTFGDQYRRYRRNVGALIPFVSVNR